MNTIKNYIKQYLKWREKQKERELAEREERVSWYREKMGSAKKIRGFNEKDLHELMEKLWALGFWKNKSYKVKKLIKDNGLEKIKEGFINLLYSDKPIEIRWDNFRKTTKGFGPSSISEILTLVFPDKYGIMNMKSLTILPFLGYLTENEIKRISYGYTSGRDYKYFMNALQKIQEELKNNGLPRADLIDVDFFIWYLFEPLLGLTHKRDKKEILRIRLEEKPLSSKPTIKKITSHQEAELILLQLGCILGYDTYSPDRSKLAFKQKLENFITLKEIPPSPTPTLLDTIKNIDVIWFEDEFPICCFEVEHTTGVTNGLVRLANVSQLNTKLFVIAPEDILKRFILETKKLIFRKVEYIFRSYEDLINFYYLAENYTNLKSKFFNEKT